MESRNKSNYSRFLDIEIQSQLYNIPDWQLFRPYIFLKFCKKNINGKFRPSVPFFVQIFYSIITILITRKTNKKVYFGAPRIVGGAIQDEGLDVLTDIGDVLYINQSKFPVNGRFNFSTPTGIIKILSFFLSFFLNFRVTKELHKKLLENGLNYRRRYLNEIIIYHKLSYFYFKHLLKRLKVNKIFYTRSDNYYSLLKASKDLAIKSIEFQHGDIVKEEVSINHSIDKSDLIVAPSILLLYSLNWVKDLYIGSKTQLIVVGKKRPFIRSGEYQTVFLIDTFLCYEQVNFLDDLLKFYNGKIILKIHPNLNYKYLFEFFKKKYKCYDNIKVVHRNLTFNQILNDKTTVIGKYSTALYFTASLGIKTYLINSDFRTIEKGKLDCVESYDSYSFLINDLSSNIELLFNKKKRESDYFYSKYNIDLIKSI